MGAVKMEENNRPDAFDWAYNRYIKGDPEREASFQEELVKAEIASQIYALRAQAGMTQQQLAELVGTEASVIDDIEAADSEGDFFSMALRIASVLHKKVEVRLVPEEKPESRVCGL
jgi:ribosome-binding protein aMBF1 (putative translation factor)